MSKMKDLRLDNNLVLKGMWALKTEDLIGDDGKFTEKAKPGNLELSEGRIVLDLNGILKKWKDDSYNESLRIYGYLDSGLYVILEKCLIISMSFSSGYKVQKYIANSAYLLNINSSDIVLKNENKIMATKVNFGIDYLDNWYNVDLPTFENKNSNVFTVSYSNKFSNENSFEILDRDYILSLKRDIKAYHVINEGPQVKFDTFISVYTNDYEPKSVETFIDITNWVLKFNDFITQTYGKYLYFEFLLEDKNNKYRYEELDNGEVIFHYPLYTGRLIFPQASDKQPKIGHDSLRLNDIKENYGNLISAWFKKKENLEYIIDLYYQNRIVSLDIQSILVNKIKMMETYYDNFLYGKREEAIDEDSEVNNVIRSIKDWMGDSKIKIPIKEEIIRKLDKKCKRNSHATLREKLTVILKDLPEELKIIFSKIDIRCKDDFVLDFAERLKDTRNFYTHGANRKRHKKRFTTTNEIIKASSILDCVIYYFVLKALDVEEEKILNYPFMKKTISEIKSKIQ